MVRDPRDVRFVTGMVALLLSLAAGITLPSAVDDGVQLTVRQGFTAEEVRLDWVGGSPIYRVYRSADPADVVAPANLMGETSGGAWLDTPPAGRIFYYFVTANCPATVELCNGVDDDCDGQVDEGCPTICGSDADCRPEQHCEGDRCVADLPDGGACQADSWCAGGHCGNGFCCAAGDCCATAGDCAAYAIPPACEDAATCQGSRGEAVCSTSYQCGTLRVEDDSACGPGVLSQGCGPYADLYCTGAISQPADQAPLCPTSCGTDADCDAAAHCTDGACLYDQPQGSTCARTAECLPGLFCVDGVCCASSCDGTCLACDLAGNEGACMAVPYGADPDNECGGVSCSDYYHGWIGDSCYRKADVADFQADCNGAGSCLTQAQECAMQTARGALQITCDSLCQDPQAGTCTGTTPGSCVNVTPSPSTQTCGVGACQRTTQRCSNGTPVTCVPGAPTAETCNNIDDDCDGQVDDGLPVDSAEPNNSCTSVLSLGSIGSDQTRGFNYTLYPSGDYDYYVISATETDSSCACCDFFCLDEDYRMQVTLTVPSGAGAYQLCVNNGSCSGFAGCTTVSAGTSGTLTLLLDGACPGNDSYTIYTRIAPAGGAGYECLPYTLSFFFNALVCN